MQLVILFSRSGTYDVALFQIKAFYWIKWKWESNWIWKIHLLKRSQRKKRSGEYLFGIDSMSFITKCSFCSHSSSPQFLTYVLTRSCETHRNVSHVTIQRRKKRNIFHNTYTINKSICFHSVDSIFFPVWFEFWHALHSSSKVYANKLIFILKVAYLM